MAKKHLPIGALLGAMLALNCAHADSHDAPADILFRGGTLYSHPMPASGADAVAVRDGIIRFVGSAEEAARYIGPSTRVVDLHGRMLMPGIVDAHVHPLGGAEKALYQCNFPFSATPDNIQAALARCVADQPDADWIVGGQWDSALFERFDIESPRGLLDEVSDDVAVLLIDDTGHNGWINTRALELAGITRDTADPSGGSIGRSADGTPNGLLLETAYGLVSELIPAYTDEQRLDAAIWFSNTANAFGIIAVKAASIQESEIKAFKRADEAGQLNVHVATSMATPYGHRTDALDYDELDRIRDTYASNLVHTNFVKVFLDGVPTPARTAAMIHPYVPDDEHGDTFTGELHIGVETLSADLIELDRRGYTVKIHTAGDRSVRVALDAIERARDVTGSADKRHELAHAGYIDPADLPRFAELNAVADFSPVIWHPSPIIDAVIMAVGKERGERYWPVRDLLDSGAPVLAGSDWPSAVPDANPWVGIEAFVTRRDPRGEAEGALWPEQAITLDEALAIYTMHGARAMRLDDRIGSIEVGKRADLIVLEHDLFDTPIEEVGSTQVDETYFGGIRVFVRNAGD